MSRWLQRHIRIRGSHKSNAFMSRSLCRTKTQPKYHLVCMIQQSKDEYICSSTLKAPFLASVNFQHLLDPSTNRALRPAGRERGRIQPPAVTSDRASNDDGACTRSQALSIPTKPEFPLSGFIGVNIMRHGLSLARSLTPSIFKPFISTEASKPSQLH